MKILKNIALALFILLITISANATQMSMEVQEMVKKHKLEIVDFNYVNKAIGNGTRKNASSVILDARPVKKYKASHIPSAIALPDTEFEKYYNSLKISILKDKSKEIIVYCGGVKCIKSPKVASYLLENGHTNVKVYLDGMPHWAKQSYVEIDISMAKALFDKQDALFIDARPYGKFVASTIVNSINVPDTKFDKFSKFMPNDKNVNIITFCGGMACHKSHVVASKLVEMGYKNVKVFAAGFPKWKSQEYPITGKSNNSTTQAKEYVPTKSKSGNVMKGADKGSVDGKWFVKNYLNLDKSVTLVDVRDKKDFESGHLKGAIHIQVEKMKPQELAKVIPQKGDVIFYCGTGTRAMEAQGFLKDINYKNLDFVWYLDANIDCDRYNNCKIKPNEPIGL